MPDQNDASTEHALIQEIAEPLASLPDDPLPIGADVEFPVVMRGYDRNAVDDYVRRTSQLVAELQATRSPEAAIRRALERVGEEVSGILQRAHESAERITVHSRTESEERMERARAEAHELTGDAERRVAELDAETDAIWAERRRIVSDVNALASQLTELAESALERFPAEEATESAAVDEPLGDGLPADAAHAGETPADELLHHEPPPGELSHDESPTQVIRAPTAARPGDDPPATQPFDVETVHDAERSEQDPGHR